MKLADEPLAPKKKSKSKVKLAAKATKKAKKRGAIGTATLMTRAYWGSLFDPAYSPFPKKKKSNIHGVYDDDVSNAPARPHIASAGAAGSAAPDFREEEPVLVGMAKPSPFEKAGPGMIAGKNLTRLCPGVALIFLVEGFTCNYHITQFINARLNGAVGPPHI